MPMNSMEAISIETRAAKQLLFHSDFVRALASKFAPWPGLTDDISQQVFLEFLAKEQQWNLEGDLRPLLTKMTRNIASRYWRDLFRKREETVSKIAEYIRQLSTEDETASYRDDRVVALQCCIAHLSCAEQTLVRLRYESGLSTAQIGLQLNMSTDAVCQALCRLRCKLRKGIERHLTSRTQV